jgi:hypothetical protein
MASQRKHVSNQLKKRLFRAAGNKCANPGCASRRAHLHHIREWAVYETHDEQHMIAVCPNCHDSVHHGELAISDEVLYQWKALGRQGNSVRTHLYIEPGLHTKILLGTVAVSSPQEVIIFELSRNNRFKFRIADKDILLLSLSVSSLLGNEVLRITDNHIRHEPDSSVVFRQVPGHLQITVPNNSHYLPEWAIDRMRAHEPNYGQGKTLTLLDLEVMHPGLVRAQGFWAEREKVVVVTKERLSFIRPTSNEPLSLCAAGETVLLVDRSINSTLFGF